MFSPESITRLAQENQDVLKHLWDIEVELNKRYLASETYVRGLVLAVATGEPLVFVGPPGTAKSHMVRAFHELSGLADEAYFEYLLSPFTEPSELFGYYDLKRLNDPRDGDLVRLEDGTLQRANIVFLDEVFNASSALMNSLLAVLNERFFHDRGHRTKVKFDCFFSATNNVPQTRELLAFFDRFLFRVFVYNIAADSPATEADDGQQTVFEDLLEELTDRGWSQTYSKDYERLQFKDLLSDLRDFRATVNAEIKPNGDREFIVNYASFIRRARDRGLSAMSNRRIIKITYAMLIHRIYEAARGGDAVMQFDDLQLIPRYFLDRQDSVTNDRLSAWIDLRK